MVIFFPYFSKILFSFSMEYSNNTIQNPQTLHNNINNNLQDFDWLHEDLFPLDNVFEELPSLYKDEFLEFNNSHSLLPIIHWDNNHVLELEGEIMSMRMVKLEDDDQVERLGLLEEEEEERLRNINGRRRGKSSLVLGLEEIQKHFHRPITEAAKEMNVGLTVLKRRCRQLNIMRWPHRKLKSLNSLIQNVKEMGLTNEVKGLEEHKRQLEELPNMDLTHTTKRLRQACFKANYKKKRIIRSQ